MMDKLSAIADAVQKAVRAIPDGVDIGEELCMGADGTPTSQIDKIAENTVLMFIESNHLPMNVLSEEIGFVDNGAKDTLILDPIDGTRNAVLGIPYYTVSLALTDSDLNGVHTALLRNLVTGDEYRAEKGKGATYNGRPIHAKTRYDPRDITLNIYLGRSSDPNAYAVAKRVKASRSMGCASLDMASVALGRADGFLMQSENYNHSIRVVAHTHGWCCTEDRKSCRIVHSFIERDGLKGRHTLVVIHGKNGIEVVVVARSEELIGCIRTHTAYPTFEQFVNDRNDDFLFFLAVGMRIECKYCYAWIINEEITFQAVVQDDQTLCQRLFGDV